MDLLTLTHEIAKNDQRNPNLNIWYCGSEGFICLVFDCFKGVVSTNRLYHYLSSMIIIDKLLDDKEKFFITKLEPNIIRFGGTIDLRHMGRIEFKFDSDILLMTVWSADGNSFEEIKNSFEFTSQTKEFQKVHDFSLKLDEYLSDSEINESQENNKELLMKNVMHLIHDNFGAPYT